MLSWKLRIHEPSQPKEREVVIDEGTVLGRSRDCGVVLNDPYVSGRHAEVSRAKAGLEFRQLGTARTVIEGGPALQRGDSHPLSDGLVVMMGLTRIVVVAPATSSIRSGAAATAAVPADAPAGDLTRQSPLYDTTMREGIAPVSAPPAAEEEEAEHTIADSAWQRAPAAPPAPPAPPTPPVPVAAPRAEPAPPVAARPPNTGFASDYDVTIMQQSDRLSGVAMQAMLQKACPRLTFCNEMLHEIVDIQVAEFVIGRRKKDNPHLLIDHPSISSRHARIFFDGNRFFIEDLGSSNRTFVYDGARKEQLAPQSRRELLPDTRVVFGGIEALFTVDVDGDGVPIARPALDRALQGLVRSRRVSEVQVTKARLTARNEGRHAGEILIRDRAIDVAQWLEGMESARREELSRRSVGGLLIALYVMGALVLGIFGVLVWFIFFRN